jgi:hypothetical protein
MDAGVAFCVSPLCLLPISVLMLWVSDSFRTGMGKKETLFLGYIERWWFGLVSHCHDAMLVTIRSLSYGLFISNMFRF